MQWIGLPSSTFGETCETIRYLHSIDSFFFFFYRQSRLYYDYQEYEFLKNERWQFIIRRICQSISFFLFLKNVTCHFDYEVERQMKHVKPSTPIIIPFFSCGEGGRQGINLKGWLYFIGKGNLKIFLSKWRVTSKIALHVCIEVFVESAHYHVYHLSDVENYNISETKEHTWWKDRTNLVIKHD